MYDNAIDILDDSIPHLVTHILNLGEPIQDPKTETAHIQRGNDGLEIHINPSFEESIDEYDYAFILSHETMHGLLGHLLVMKDYDNTDKFSIATDCVINDYLASQGIVPSQFKPYYGENVVGYNTAQTPLRQVYDDIPNDMQPQMINGSGGDLGGDLGGGESDGDESGEADGGGLVDDHSKMDNGDDLEDILSDFLGQNTNLPDDLIDMIMDENSEAAIEGGLSPGSSFDIREEEINIPDGLTMKWVKLLQKINPDVWKTRAVDLGKKYSWRRVNNKLIAVYPDLILPAPVGGGGNEGKEEEQKSIVLALDTSGSIPKSMQDRLTKLAKSVPQDKIHVFCCTFSTNYVPFDINSDKNRVAGGGTDFSAVERYIQHHVYEKLDSYPTAVVVITDLDAYFRKEKPGKKLKNWLFLNCGSHLTQTKDSYANAVAEIEKLSEYVVN